MALAFLAVGTGMGLARQGGAGALDTLYAEDGQVFLGQALGDSPVDAFSTPYVGYFHAVPRLIAEVVAAAPLESAAALFASISAFVVACVGLLVYRASASHIESRLVRSLLAASVVLIPVGQRDALNNAANLHWFLMFGGVWVLLWRTDVVWELAAGSMVLFLAALSDPITIVLVPIAVARLVALKGVQGRIFSFACLAGLAVQLVAILLSDARREDLSPTFNPIELAVLYGYWVVAAAMVGIRFVADPRARSNQAAAVAALLVAAVIAVGILRAGTRFKPAVAVLFVMSVLFYLAPVAPTGGSPQRYAVAPVLLLFSGIACAADVLVVGRQMTPRQRSAWTACLLMIVAIWGANFRVANERGRGQRWSAALVQARSTCSEESASDVTVPITPPGWHITLPCAVAGPSSTSTPR